MSDELRAVATELLRLYDRDEITVEGCSIGQCNNPRCLEWVDAANNLRRALLARPVDEPQQTYVRELLDSLLDDVRLLYAIADGVNSTGLAAHALKMQQQIEEFFMAHHVESCPNYDKPHWCDPAFIESDTKEPR